MIVLPVITGMMRKLSTTSQLSVQRVKTWPRNTASTANNRSCSGGNQVGHGLSALTDLRSAGMVITPAFILFWGGGAVFAVDLGSRRILMPDLQTARKPNETIGTCVTMRRGEG